MVKNKNISKNKQDDSDSKSNLKSKLFIVIVFLIAITFAVMSFILGVQNNKLEKRLINTAWKLEVRKSNSIINEQSIKAPDNSAEYVEVAKDMKDVVRQYHQLKSKGELKDDREDRREMVKNIQYTLNDLGITSGYDPNPEPVKTYKKSRSKKSRKDDILYEGVNVKFTKPVSRSKIIQFIMNIEDKYPFLTAQYLKIYRDKNDDEGDSDEWKGEVKFIWFFKNQT